MDLEAHTNDELKQLLVVKYGRDTFPADLTVLKQCPICRELILREWNIRQSAVSTNSKS